MKDLIDFLFPPRCPLCHARTALCKDCLPFVYRYNDYCLQCGEASESSLCILCQSASLPFRSIRSGGLYYTKERTLLHAIKYGKRVELIKPLCHTMAPVLQSMPDDNWTSIIPIPSHPKQLRRRGFHVSAFIARSLLKDIGYSGKTLDCLSLMRLADGMPQASQDHAMRPLNIKGQYHCIRTKPFPGRVLLIDDVLTTGATLLEVVRTLSPFLQSPPDVFTLFRAPRWRNMIHTLMIAEEIGITAS